MVEQDPSTNYEFKVRVPKDQYLQAFTDYVICDDGDKYEEKTKLESIFFDPKELVIDIYNQSVIEKHQNEAPSTVWDFEHLLGKVEVLLQALEREEQIWKSQIYNDLTTNNPKMTVKAIENHILSASLDDSVGQLFWRYIGTAKQDTANLKICIKAHTSHQFKCKQIYQTLYGQRKG